MKKSPYYLLEDEFEVLLVNAAHVKHVPGRKTNTIDAAWFALLLSRGLLRVSFVPPPPIRELRDLTRYRKALINERTSEVNRIHKTAPGRSRHQPVGRDPITLAASITSIRTASRGPISRGEVATPRRTTVAHAGRSLVVASRPSPYGKSGTGQSVS
jgi:transposase